MYILKFSYNICIKQYYTKYLNICIKHCIKFLCYDRQIQIQINMSNNDSYYLSRDINLNYST